MGAFVDSPHAANRPPNPPRPSGPSPRLVLRSPLSPLGRAHATAWLMRFVPLAPGADADADTCAGAGAGTGASSNGNLWCGGDTYDTIIRDQSAMSSTNFLGGR